MRHFRDAPEAETQLRLSVSVVTLEQIDEGVDRPARLIKERLA
ncbi:hypothetical protein [Kitasatospora aureofaciens]|nr:hypothetical protein [Kitasatospora aureofaciens]